MHAKSAEVSQFLDKDLLPQVQAAFGQYKTADKAEIEKELAKVIAGIEAAGMDPAQSPKVADLRARLANDAVDIGALESEVYDHLFSFFRRYYSEGDFLAKRVYKPGVYAIPYEGEPPAQKDLIDIAESQIFEALSTENRTLNTENFSLNTENLKLKTHLLRYTARNTFDYFIHKDLGTFLRRELDFYIKNEVMHLDDVENESAPRVEQYLSKIKVIRKIAGKIIAFLAQLEDFQKKLWLKMKFVVETQWCITVGRIPEAFYAEIGANGAQHEEWTTLCAIDELEGDLTRVGYKKKLDAEFLKAHSTLVVDTRHFDASFTARLLDAIGDTDEHTDGILTTKHSGSIRGVGC